MEQSSDGSFDLETIVRGAKAGQKLELRLWLRMLSTTKLISQEIRRRLRVEFGATLPQFDLMAQLHRQRGGLRLGELSKRTMVTNGNITGLIDRLEADGLLLRDKLAGDRRVTVARLSKRGEDVFDTMAAAHENWLREMMADVEAELAGQLLEHLGTVKASVSAHVSQSEAD